MPLILTKDTGRGTLLLWSVCESEDRLRACVTEQDRASADGFASRARRLEHLAWRAALRTMISDGMISYTETGAPVVAGSSLHIGVAHTRGLAVVIVSTEPCAVDAECAARDFGRSCARFISPHEARLADAARPDFAAAVWCAKEAMYKYSGRRGLDFLRDMQVTGSDLARGMMQGRVCGTEVSLGALREGEYLIIYTD